MIPWSLIKKRLKYNFFTNFLWLLIGKWYVIIGLASIITLYWVVKGLDEIGFIKAFQQQMVLQLELTKTAAKNCIPRLGSTPDSLHVFWNCLSNPGAYEPDPKARQQEQRLEKQLDKMAKPPYKKNQQQNQNNPYDNNDHQ